MVEESESEAFAELTAEEEEREAEKREALAEIAEFSPASPSNLSQYQDRFADGLPANFTPEVVEFFDTRNRLSQWFPRLETVDIPTIDTEILSLNGGGGKDFLEEEEIDPIGIIMTEDPEPVFNFFGQPDFDAIESFVENTDNKQAFLRSDYKSATNLGDGNHIEVGSKPEIVRTVMHQLQDRLMAEMPPFTPLPLREHLDLDFYPDGRYTLHPEVRFFIADGEVLYHFPRVDKETFARADDGVAHYERVINAIDDDVDQLYEWAHRAAQEFDESSWSLDFVMDTSGNWVATDMALNGLYYSSEKNRWHNLSEHNTGSPYNLEEQIGSAFQKPEAPDDGGEPTR